MPSYSRDFSLNNGDRVTRLNTNPDIICKSSFYAGALEGFLDNNPTTAYVKVTVAPWSLNNNKNIFSLSAYNSAHAYLATIEGDFPCPDECIPPEPQIVEPNNSFDIADIRDALGFTGIALLNVHSATRPVGSLIYETRCIYPVTGSDPNWDAHYGEDDPAYISEMTV